MWLQSLGSENDPIATLSKESGLTRPQIEAAKRYGDAYPAEITARIDLHVHETAAAKAG
jgi:hypothetical protein